MYIWGKLYLFILLFYDNSYVLYCVYTVKHWEQNGLDSMPTNW